MNQSRPVCQPRMDPCKTPPQPFPASNTNHFFFFSLSFFLSRLLSLICPFHPCETRDPNTSQPTFLYLSLSSLFFFIHSFSFAFFAFLFFFFSCSLSMKDLRGQKEGQEVCKRTTYCRVSGTLNDQSSIWPRSQFFISRPFFARTPACPTAPIQ